jgi:DNA-binding beta-propeller fold protein YncE
MMFRNVVLAGAVSLMTIAACDSADDSDSSRATAGNSGAASSDGGRAGTPHDAEGGAGRAGRQDHGGESGRDLGHAGMGVALGTAGAGGDPSRGGADVGSRGGDPGEGVHGGEGGGADIAPAGIAYISTLLGDLLIASLDPQSGVPTLLPSSPVSVDGFSHGVAVSPGQDFLFVPAQPARIDTFQIALDGSLSAEPSSSVVVDDENPLLSIALDPLGRFAYGVSPFSKRIYVFTIDPATGALTLSGEPLSVGTAPDHRAPAFVAPAPSGRFVYVTQMAAGPAPDDGIRAYRVDQVSGRLTELADSPFNLGSVIAGAIVFRPDGKFLFT